MYNEKLLLSTEEILNKEFKIDARGYRPQEVDKFLDMVIKDYTEYNNIVRKLEKDNQALTDEVNRLRAEIRRIKTNIEAAESSSGSSVSNVDLLRRLSQLEKVVFGKNQ